MVSARQVSTVKIGTELQSSRWLVPSLVALLTVLVFLPVLENGFVDWDDKSNFLENRSYRGLGWEQLRWMFTTFHKGHYQPVSWVTLGLDYLLWGMNPFGYHLTSLLLHVANTVLFYFLAYRLLALAFSVTAAEAFSLRFSAGITALIFAIHPLRVESVAWATERRDVLSALFFLLTIHLYLWANGQTQSRRTRIWRLSGSLAMYGLSLLSKAGGMTLPVVLLVLDVYPLKRFAGHGRYWFGRAARGVWLEKVPFLILASATAVVALLAQHEAGALESMESYGSLARMAQASFGLVFYLWKTVVPLGLSPLYEIPPELNPWDWQFLLSGVLVVGISLTLFLLRRHWPAGLAVWICYVALLAPVLGVAQSGNQFVADRYSYLSCLGWAILVGAGLFHCWRVGVAHDPGRLRIIAGGLVGLTVAGLGGLTWKQSQIWYDTDRLWRHALAVDQESKRPHNNLGVLLASEGKLVEAIQHYQRAVRIDPKYVKAHNNLGNALWTQGDTEKAMQHYHEAIRFDPDNDAAHYNLGNALRSQGKLDQAIGHYEQAVQANPTYSTAYNNLGITLAQQGRLDEAIDKFLESLRIDPSNAPVYANLANIYTSRGELEKAVDHYRQALAIEPDFAEVHERLGRLLTQLGKQEEAIQHLEEAVRLMKIGKEPNRRKSEK